MTGTGSIHSRRASSCLRDAISEGQRLAGTFVKTTHYQIVEVLAGTELDFVVLDAEHAPFGRESLDACCLAARAGHLPALVRTASSRPEDILQALDCGASGVLVPHVDDAEIASAVVRSARYREANGARGFSNSPRAGGYGELTLAKHISESDQRTTVIVQIETATSVENIGEIAQTPGIDALFVGRADLAVSYGVDSITHPRVQEAVEHICQVAQACGQPLGIFLPDTAELDVFTALGFTFFIIASDQGLLKRHVKQVAAQILATAPS
ncbi:aldolase [Pollutimonas subterranea]|uniref:Aldolase n=1 Tax=Pollutimonas subterranea TaxID=2045210 RepID=A0A2N4U6Y6_9BURK|nr:aldolase/citrate lyase family protein [Pollutimonas subterranea]PLC50780.1 aldolase [Pollutimonas subterranea]